ncbi:MAG: hypothetical protein AVDCRST_MAG04-755, partial [uncultured Acetobacteraceae bacterium]
GGRGRRPPPRHGQPVAPPSKIPARRRPAAQATHAVPHPPRRPAGPAAL